MASIFTLFVPAIRDYIDIVNNIYDSTINTTNLMQLLQQSLLYFFASIKFIIVYFFSFQWIQDLSYLPVVVPQIKLDIVKEHFFLQSPQSNFFTFLEIPSYSHNKFFLGFLNSFFLCLPLSVAHLISLRRLLIQGLPAGIFASLGTIFGQILLLICILFGGRLFIIPWFNFQVLNYFIGFWLVLKTVYDMCHERSIRIIEKNNLPILSKIFLLNFLLAWTEQSCIFQYFGNLTLGAEPSIIEIFSSLSVFQSILTHATYISGIIVGMLFFTSFFIFITLKLSNMCVQFLSILYSKWIRRVNLSLIVMIVAFSFTSIPFYSFDYLVLSNFGFVAQDKIFQNTLFSPTKIYDYPSAILGDGHLLNNYVDHKPGIDTDIAPFNKGRYLMFDVNDSFEQLNYQGEYAWLTKKNRIPTLTKDPSSSPVFSKIAKLFKKKKKYTNEPLFISDSNTEKTGKNNSKFQNRNFKNTNESLKNVARRDSPEENVQNSNLMSIEKDQPSDLNENFQLNFDETENLINVLDSRSQNDGFMSDSFEKLINISTSSQFFIKNPISKSIVEKKFQQRYYSNPVYKILLRADIDFFLSRQPKSISLSPKEEQELFKKRIILSNYYDSLRYYNQLPYEEEFKEFFNGSKSYADRVYNHQFNGTLKIVRRLFSINEFLNEENIENIKDDLEKKKQPLSTQNSQNNFSNFTNLNKLPLQNKSNEIENFLKNKNEEKFVLKFDQALYKKIKNKNNVNSIDKNFFHEEFNLNRKSNINLNTNLKSEKSNFTRGETLKYSLFSDNVLPPFIELTNPTPFYVGWDEQLRKLVLTNRLSSKRLSGESMKFLLKNSNTKYFGLNKLIKKNKTITFTTWPLLSNKSQKLLFKKGNLNFSQTPEKNFFIDKSDIISYNFLVDSLQTSKNMDTYNKLVENDLDLKITLNDKNIPTNAYGELFSIPTNILSKGGKPVDSQMKNIIPYTRGGFIWPGHSYLKINFKNLISAQLQN